MSDNKLVFAACSGIHLHDYFLNRCNFSLYYGLVPGIYENVNILDAV